MPPVLGSEPVHCKVIMMVRAACFDAADALQSPPQRRYSPGMFSERLKRLEYVYIAAPLWMKVLHSGH